MDSIKAFFAYFAREGRVILQAPATFATALFGLIVLIWSALSWRYSGQIENLQSTVATKGGIISAKDAAISDYKDKLSGATPDEAKKRIDALELQVAALSPRRLSQEHQRAMESVALTAKGSVIEIASDMAIADARPFTADLARVFQKAGWNVSLPMIMGPSNPPSSGLALRVEDPSHLGPAALVAKATLEAGHLVFDLQSGLRTFSSPPAGMEGPYPPVADVELLVTSR